MKKNKTFTLVEIIVVISIIIILAAIATINLRKQLKSSQDVSRITSINTIGNGLKQYYSKYSFYPIPDNNKQLYYGNTLLSYQGKVDNNVANSIGLKSLPMDPTKDTLFNYTTNYNNTNFQLLTFLENEKAYKYGSNKVYRKYYSLGDNVGFIFINGNTDISSNIDLKGNNNNYTAIFSNISYFPQMIGEDIGIGKILLDPDLHNKLSDIVLSLTFEKGNSSQVYDLSQYNNNGILTGTIIPQYVGGRKGYGLKFLGSSFVEVKDDNSLDLNQFSIGFWINISSTPSNEVFIIDKGNNYKISITNINKLRCNINGNTIESSFSLNNGNWYYILCEFNGSVSKLYINSNLNVTNNSNININNQNIIIGNNFNGLLDEILILNKAISDNLIKLLYQN